MAVFTCYVPTDIFGGGTPPSFNLSAGDGSFFELDSQRFISFSADHLGITRMERPLATWIASAYITTMAR